MPAGKYFLGTIGCSPITDSQAWYTCTISRGWTAGMGIGLFRKGGDSGGRVRIVKDY